MSAPTPLRWPDGLVLVTLVGFAATSFLFDRAAALDLVAPDSADPFGRALWSYGQRFDPLVAENPLFLRVMSGISAFVFGPFYLWAARALWRADPRLLGVAPWYAAAMLYSMVVHIVVELRHEVPPPDTVLLLLIYLPYVALPLALPWRAALRVRS
jgi:EXPERA (EXPanded EBP superfamily)